MSINSQKEQPLQDVLVFSAELPLCWQVLSSPPSAEELLTLNKNNEKLLEVILISDEIVTDNEHQVNKDIWQELRKLDAKMNMLMDWVGSLILQQQGINQRYPIEMSAHGMEFICSQNQTPGELISVGIFLEANYPQALNVTATVLNSEHDSNGNRVCVEFVEMNEHVQSLLEKYIFRIHRRSIAQYRKNN